MIISKKFLALLGACAMLAFTSQAVMAAKLSCYSDRGGKSEIAAAKHSVHNCCKAGKGGGKSWSCDVDITYQKKTIKANKVVKCDNIKAGPECSGGGG